MTTKPFIIAAFLLAAFLHPIQSQSLLGSAGQSGSNQGIHLSWSIGEPLIHTFTGSTVALTQGYQQAWEKYRVYGVLTYANAFVTPVRDVDVSIHSIVTATVREAISNMDGYFYLYDLPQGSYRFTGISNKAAGSVNATDALLVAKHFVQQIQLSGIHRLAADVDASGSINSTDALQICRLFVDSITSFPAGNWLVSDDTILLGAGTQRHDIQALCFGDVNGSYVPEGVLKQSLWLRQSGEMKFLASDEMLIPIWVGTSCEIGAISLVISEPKGELEFLGVHIPAPFGDLNYSIKGGVVRLAWFSAETMKLNTGEPVLWIRARLKDAPSYLGSGIAFQLGIESEIADGLAWPYAHVDLFMPDIKIDMIPAVLSIDYLFPNPASDRLHLRFGMPNDARVSLGVHDLHGALISQHGSKQVRAGVLEWDLDVSHLPTGLYFVHLRLPDVIPRNPIVRKFVVIRD